MNNHTVFVYPTNASRTHWMTLRMFKRAGLNPLDYEHWIEDSTILERLNRSRFHVAVLLGEQVLSDLLERRDILRWTNRIVPFKLKDRQLWAVPCLEPRLLLPRKTEEAERGKRVLRSPSRYQGMVVETLKRSLDVPRDYAISPVDYLCDPTPNRFREWVGDFYQWVALGHSPVLSWDIETPYKMSEDDEEEFEENKRKVEKIILRISFAYKPNEAVSIPWQGEYLDAVRELLAYNGDHLGWNCIGFDVPIVQANRMVIGGRVLDGMDAFHLWQTDLDKGLEFATGMGTDILPWKHLSDSEPARYSCIDADAALRNFGYLQDRLREVGLLDRFYTEMDIMNLLVEAGQRGNYINNEFRLKYKAELEAMLFTQLKAAQGLVATKFLKRKLYKKLPKTATPEAWEPFEMPIEVNACDGCDQLRPSKKHRCKGTPDTWKKITKTINHIHYFERDALSSITTLEGMNDYLSASGFNPGSADQLKKYMRAHKHPVGKNHKTDKDTADIKHIQKLVVKYGGQHPIYSAALSVRKIQKALSTYVVGLAPDERNRIGTSYCNAPSTWRLSSRSINVQNLGKRNSNPLATKARAIIVPSPGHVLVQADSSAVEAVMSGFFMGDAKYISLARKGVHSFVCCQWLKIPFTDDNIKLVKSDHKKLYDDFKITNHSINYGAGPYQMHMNDPEKFPTIKAAETMYKFVFAQLPGLERWHRELQIFAQKNGYLDNPWGLRHHFYDVFTYKHDDDGELIFGNDGLPQIKLGKDGKRCIAFKPQSSNGMFQRDNILLLGQTEARKWMPAMVTVHDSLQLDVPIAKMDVAVNILADILTRPIKEMGNLRIGCEVEVAEVNLLDTRSIKVVTVE